MMGLWKLTEVPTLLDYVALMASPEVLPNEVLDTALTALCDELMTLMELSDHV